MTGIMGSPGGVHGINPLATGLLLLMSPRQPLRFLPGSLVLLGRSSRPPAWRRGGRGGNTYLGGTFLLLVPRRLIKGCYDFALGKMNCNNLVSEIWYAYGKSSVFFIYLFKVMIINWVPIDGSSLSRNKVKQQKGRLIEITYGLCLVNLEMLYSILWLILYQILIFKLQ